jgi:hypothetical protein
MNVFLIFLFIFILLPFCMRPVGRRRDNSPFPGSRWTVPAGRKAFEQSKHKGDEQFLNATTLRFLGTVEQFRQVGKHLNNLNTKEGWTIVELSRGELNSIRKENNQKPRESLEQLWQVGQHLNNLKTKGAEQFLNIQKESWTALEKKRIWSQERVWNSSGRSDSIWTI